MDNPTPANQALQMTVMELLQAKLEWQANALTLQAEVAELKQRLADAQPHPVPQAAE